MQYIALCVIMTRPPESPQLRVMFGNGICSGSGLMRLILILNLLDLGLRGVGGGKKRERSFSNLALTSYAIKLSYLINQLNELASKLVYIQMSKRQVVSWKNWCK